MSKYVEAIMDVAKGKQAQFKRNGVFDANGKLIREFGNLRASASAYIIQDKSNNTNPRDYNISGYGLTMVLTTEMIDAIIKRVEQDNNLQEK